MTVGRVSTIAMIAALMLAVPSRWAASEGTSLQMQLVGTWTLSSWIQVRQDGSRFHRFGLNPNGIQIFDAKSNFFALFARPDLSAVANPQAPTPEEANALLQGAVGYFGTYTLDAEFRVMKLRVSASTFPNLLAADNQRRITSVTADELKFVDTSVTSEGQTFVVMKRAR